MDWPKVAAIHRLVIMRSLIGTSSRWPLTDYCRRVTIVTNIQNDLFHPEN